jgi:RIO-like serine/threonine protein kinase
MTAAMTASSVQKHTDTTTTPADELDKREVAIQAIMRETQCKRRTASATLKLVEHWVERSRKADYDWAYPTNRELAKRAYQIFARVIPHGTRVPAIGSAHEAIAAAVLEGDEFSLEHDMVGEGKRVYCGVLVRVNYVG